MNTTTKDFVKKSINALKSEDINTALYILQLLAITSYDNMNISKGEKYRKTLDKIESDIVHIKELLLEV